MADTNEIIKIYTRILNETLEGKNLKANEQQLLDAITEMDQSIAVRKTQLITNPHEVPSEGFIKFNSELKDLLKLIQEKIGSGLN